MNTGALTAGNNAVLEVFFIQNGANTDVVFENVAFGSASALELETTITLVGVTAANVHLVDGLITVS